MPCEELGEMPMKLMTALLLTTAVFLSSCSQNIRALEGARDGYEKQISNAEKASPRFALEKKSQYEPLSDHALAELASSADSRSAASDAAEPLLAPAGRENQEKSQAPEAEELSFSGVMGKIGHHYTRDHWKGTWKQAFAPKYLLFYSAFAGAALAIDEYDKDIQRDFQRHHYMGDDLAHADTGLAIAFPAFTAFYLIPFHPPGPEQQKFDDMAVFGELMLSTAAVVYPLKGIINAKRPGSDDKDSFPSAHTAFAFATAAYIDDMYGPRYGWKARLPAYAVATFVGLSRIENNDHFASEVLGSVAIGVLIEKFIYKWHYAEGGVSPHRKKEEAGLLIVPVVNEEESSIYLVKSF